MSEPIRTKPKSSMKIDNAPTPHNTPASVLTGSFLKNGNPVANKPASTEEAIPQTISEEDIQSALSNQPLLLQSIQDKLGSLVGQDSGYVSQLPQVVKDRIYGLKKIQNDLFSLEKDFQIEMFELEQKYLVKYAPLHERRSKIISGDEEPTTEEIARGKELELENGEDVKQQEEEGEEDAEIEGIPSFWLTALENLPVVSDTITDRDAEILDFLTDIKVEYLTNGKPGFKLIFEFDPETPFLKEKTLTKTYYYQSELGYSGDFIYDHADGQEIAWVDNESNPTISVEMRKQRNKVTKQVRTIEKITPIDSFFNFFDPPKVPSSAGKQSKEQTEEDEEEEEELQDEDELAELEARLALDYSIGEQLKDKLVPRAVDWFTGTALEFEFEDDTAEDEFDGEFQDEDDEDEDDDDDDDGDDDDEEPDDFAGKKEQPPDCKQS